MSSLSYRPELDGLRSIAVYLVLLFHAGMVTVDGGFVGVDLFFVLSGFLVTGVILREVDQRGTFSLGDFYARRVRRLLPAAVVVVLLTASLQLLLAGLPTRVDLIDDARASLLYFANWHFILESRDYFADTDQASPFLHFWSLSIEEQFYIGFPLLVFAMLRLSKRPMRLLVILLALLTVVSVALQVWHARSDVDYAYYATETRIYQLTAGALLTILVRAVARYGLVESCRRGSGLVAVGGLALLLAVATVIDASASTRGLLATVAAVAAIWGLWWAPRGWLSRLLGLPLPRYLGQISYGTYLWHWPVILVLQQFLEVRPLVLAALAGVLSTAMAALSFTVLETPIRRSRRLVTLPWSVPVAGLSASVLAAVLVVPTVLEVERRPAVAPSAGETSAGYADLDRPVPPDLDLVAAKEDVGPPTTPCTVDEPDACVVVEGSGAHVMLIGDSQARMYVPALRRLAHKHDLTLSTNVITACPWQLGQVNLRSDPDDQDRCKQAREDFVADVLPDMDVDVVLAVGLSRSDEYWADLLEGRDGPGDETLEELQLRTTEESAKTLTEAGPDLVIAKSMFGTGGYGLEGPHPLSCLAEAKTLAACAVAPPKHRPVVDAVYDTLAIRMDAVHTADFTEAICPDRPVCRPVLGKTVVWKDPDHVTTRVLRERRKVIWKQLKATSVFD